jgi:hypothetical protein
LRPGLASIRLSRADRPAGSPGAVAPGYLEAQSFGTHNKTFRDTGRRAPIGPDGRSQEMTGPMKSKTRHRKSYKWRKKADSSPVAKGRRPKIHGTRNPRKAKRAGGRGL